PYFFTHKFTYEPTLHQFEETDLEVLGILQTISETMDVYTDHHFDIASATDRRELLIPPFMFRDLLALLKERDVTVFVGENSYTGLEVEENQLPYAFSIVPENADDLLLK